jgi:hypothetical protein
MTIVSGHGVATIPGHGYAFPDGTPVPGDIPIVRSYLHLADVRPTMIYVCGRCGLTKAGPVSDFFWDGYRIECPCRRRDVCPCCGRDIG